MSSTEGAKVCLSWLGKVKAGFGFCRIRSLGEGSGWGPDGPRHPALEILRPNLRFARGFHALPIPEITYGQIQTQVRRSRVNHE